MTVVEVLSRMAAAASDAWLAAPEGSDREVMREVADALLELATAKLQAKQPEGSERVQSMIFHVIEGSDQD